MNGIRGGGGETHFRWWKLKIYIFLRWTINRFSQAFNIQVNTQKEEKIFFFFACKTKRRQFLILKWLLFSFSVHSFSFCSFSLRWKQLFQTIPMVCRKRWLRPTDSSGKPNFQFWNGKKKMKKVKRKRFKPHFCLPCHLKQNWTKTYNLDMAFRKIPLLFSNALSYHRPHTLVHTLTRIS